MSLTVSGAVSGLDTATIIDQLIAVDQRQQSLIKAKQTAMKASSTTYGQLMTTLADLSTKATDLGKTSAWVGTKATSTATSVAVTSSGSQGGSLTFGVTSLARSHTLVSASSFGSTLDPVSSGGSVTLTSNGGTATVVDVGTGTLAEVVDGINASDAGVRATSVLVGPGQYRLQLTATTAGAANAFTVSGLDGAPTNILTQGSDAKIVVGTDPLTQYEISSTSNTFAGVVPGLSFTVSALETEVTVASTVDGSAVADKVAALVATANSALSTVKTNSTWDPATKKGGSLFGESAGRRLSMDILATIGSAQAPGVSTSRDGTVSFDRTAFLAAFSADPQAVADAIGSSSTFTPAGGVTASVSVTSTTGATRSGSYAVAVTTAAAREQWQVALPGGAAAAAGRTISLSGNGRSVSLLVGSGLTDGQLITQLNSLAGNAGLGVSATLGGSGLLLTATSPGTGGAFTADVTSGGTSTGAATRLQAGADVIGTIDGQPATFFGDILSLSTGTGDAVGLSLRVTSSATGTLGQITVDTGLAGSLAKMVKDATDATTGYVAIAKSGRDKVADDLQGQFDAWTLRLDARRATLSKQFTAMETALSAMKNQLSALQSALGTG